MKFCAVICEYNPFHNGHKYQLEEIRKRSGCDKILCVMSGNFTQRGEPAILNKYDRALHAVKNGADAVIELPVPFAVSPAEIFAAGAVHIISSIPAVKALAFGCESGDRESFLNAARATLSEDKQFKATLKEHMKDGTSYVKARTQTVLELNGDIDEALLTAPNNILGTEYCRALLQEHSAIQPLPIPRVGAGYADETPQKNFSSATALRGCLARGDKKSMKLLRGNLPACVFDDLVRAQPFPYRQAALCALIRSAPDELARCPDCSEGLENKLRTMAKSNSSYEEIIEKTVSKRYTASRLKRILMQNFLGVTRAELRAFRTDPLYCNLLAVGKKDTAEMLAALSEGPFPLLVRKSDYGALKRTALACFALDVRANDLYNALTGKHTNEYETRFL